MAKYILTSEEINRLLLSTNVHGDTAFQWAAFNGTLDVLQKMWDMGKDILTTAEIKISCYYPPTCTETHPCTGQH
jgi:ankyrin repeat protein